MPKISKLTELEIFTNPDDLQVSIILAEDIGKYSYIVGRGPGHNFKLMLSSEPVFPTADEAVKEIRNILDDICWTAESEIMDRKKIYSFYLNPDGQSIDRSKVLTPEFVDQIAKELRRLQVVSTFKIHVRAKTSPTPKAKSAKPARLRGRSHFSEAKTRPPSGGKRR